MNKGRFDDRTFKKEGKDDERVVSFNSSFFGEKI